MGFISVWDTIVYTTGLATNKLGINTGMNTDIFYIIKTASPDAPCLLKIYNMIFFKVKSGCSYIPTYHSQSI